MKRLWTNVAGTWKTVTDSYVNVGGTWKTVKQIWVKSSGTWRLAFGYQELIITSNTTHYDVFSALGSPAYPVYVEVTIDTDIVVSSTSTSTPAFDTGAMPAGSRITIINNGYIIGMGGKGGDGADHVWTVQGGCAGTVAEDGFVGGDALNLQLDTIIDNTNGYVFGGGGGAGGGNHGSFAYSTTSAGGGGGGGAGGGAGGARGIASGAVSNSDGCDGEAGTAGTSGAGGRTGGTDNESGGGCPRYATDNTGGGYGEAGDDAFAFLCPADASVGGAAGKAVDLNANSITWLAGNNSTQVKGAQT